MGTLASVARGLVVVTASIAWIAIAVSFYLNLWDAFTE